MGTLGRVSLIGIILILVVSFLNSLGGSEGGRTGAPSRPSVTATTTPPFSINISWCSGSNGFIDSNGAIKNTGLTTRSFTVNVGFFDTNGLRMGDSLDFIPDLEPGQTAVWEAGDSGDQYWWARYDYDCEIMSVDWR